MQSIPVMKPGWIISHQPGEPGAVCAMPCVEARGVSGGDMWGLATVLENQRKPTTLGHQGKYQTWTIDQDEDGSPGDVEISEEMILLYSF